MSDYEGGGMSATKVFITSYKKGEKIEHGDCLPSTP